MVDRWLIELINLLITKRFPFPFSLSTETLSAQKLRQEDIEQFKKAGKGRPVYMEAENLRKRRAEEKQEKAQEAVGDEAKKSATS